MATSAAAVLPTPLSFAGVVPRLGFLGVGWIGRNRMEAVANAGIAEVAAIADPAPETLAAALASAPGAAAADSLEGLLALGVDGIVIATPSALHAEQAVAALEAGCAVFCQKPLGRTAAEARRVVDAARAADRLLSVDFSYRCTTAMRAIRERLRAGELGRVFACDLVFHNAYGPDKAWFYDPSLAGGGCVMDLGVHLVDLALWALGWPAVERVESRLYHRGEPLSAGAALGEDYELANLDLAGGTRVRLACSWRLSAGQDAVIRADFHGTAAGATLANQSGSFYDFGAVLNRGTARETLASPPDAWGGRAAVEWARRLGEGDGFDAECEHLVQVAEVLDRIYGR
jgi:predicted dehydrogenase